MAPSKKGKGKGAVQVNVEAEAVSAKVALQNPALDAANNINGVEEVRATASCDKNLHFRGGACMQFGAAALKQSTSRLARAPKPF